MLFLLLLGQATQSGMISNSPPPPPVAVRVEPSGPTTVVVRPQPMRSLADGTGLPLLEPVTVSVRVLSGNKPLLTDQLSVGRSNATTILQRYEAPPATCPPGAPRAESTLTFQINREASQSLDEFFFGLTLSRPIDPCKIGGSLGQSVVKSVEVGPGKTVVVPGEGDLRVEISRP
jgi:hypothetical protein